MRYRAYGSGGIAISSAMYIEIKHCKVNLMACFILFCNIIGSVGIYIKIVVSYKYVV